MLFSQEKKATIENIIAKFALPDFKWIDPKDVIVAHWVRMKCTYGCNDYGRACCPPHVPSVYECKEFMQEYTSALMFRFHFMADKDHYPKTYSRKLYKTLLDLEREVFLAGYYKAFVFNQSCCSVCSECVKRKEDCKHPDKKRPTPEAFGIDVYGTARNLGFDIHVVTESHQEIDRFAILMVE